MRERLKSIGNKERHRYSAEVAQFGWKSGWNEPEPTIMLKNVRLYGNDDIITDHLWFSLGKQFQKLNLKEGDIISFNARVAKYVKGYKGDWWYFYEKTGYFPTPISTDYKLERPTKMKIESN